MWASCFCCSGSLRDARDPLLSSWKHHFISRQKSFSALRDGEQCTRVAWRQPSILLPHPPLFFKESTTDSLYFLVSEHCFHCNYNDFCCWVTVCQAGPSQVALLTLPRKLLVCGPGTELRLSMQRRESSVTPVWCCTSDISLHHSPLLSVKLAVLKNDFYATSSTNNKESVIQKNRCRICKSLNIYVRKCNVITHNNNALVGRCTTRHERTGEKCICQWMILKISLKSEWISVGKKWSKTQNSKLIYFISLLAAGIFSSKFFQIATKLLKYLHNSLAAHSNHVEKPKFSFHTPKDKILHCYKWILSWGLEKESNWLDFEFV